MLMQEWNVHKGNVNVETINEWNVNEIWMKSERNVNEMWMKGKWKVNEMWVKCEWNVNEIRKK